jgi:predicted Zn-dependent peptidase
MKKLSVVLLFVISMLSASAQKRLKPISKADAPNSVYLYESAPNDPTNTRIYTLKNGMKVYLSVNKQLPRIFSYIATKAGSKNDPANATGLAHYLEHMVFKGSDQLGTKNFEKEYPLILQIEGLYELHRKTKDEAQRKIIYHVIDSLSGEAAKFAIANEYDKAIAAIGGQSSNAYTSNEQTVYIADVPNNQLENWLKLEAERFRNPILRIFHTELEAVYEEKNKSLDSDNNKLMEGIAARLFKQHNYGQQTTIGTIEHLKNPSMKDINEYYKKYYVPNNMCVVLSGDLDFDKTIRAVDKAFGNFVPKKVDPYTYQNESELATPEQFDVYGPDAESVALGYRFSGVNSEDAEKALIMSKLLSNNVAGLLDINITQSQKALDAGVYFDGMNDYSVLYIFGSNKEGQKLEEVKDLLLAEIENLKQGKFDDWLISAIINNLKLDNMRAIQSNDGRSDEMVKAFLSNQNWKDFTERFDRLSKLTKKDIIDFANKSLKNNYVLAYKHLGEDKQVQKVVKPQITPVSVNREDQSPFLKSILAYKPKPIEPKFTDFNKDISKMPIQDGLTLLSSENKINKLFDLYYVFDMGKNHDKLLPIAIEYLSFLGTESLSSSDLKKELYKLGCAFNVYVSDDRTYVTLNGLDENMDKAVALFESLLKNCLPDNMALENLVQDILKNRADDKLNKNRILQMAMANYAKYGAKNPFTNNLNESELKALKAEACIEKIKSLEGFKHSVLYYGPRKPEAVKQTLLQYHKIPTQLKPLPNGEKFISQATGGKVYFVNYDMTQAEILRVAKGNSYKKENEAAIELYNNYFGGGMSSVIFQELRESRALAYSTYSNYAIQSDTTQPYYTLSYIGSQADKLKDAIEGLNDLVVNMPKSPLTFNAAKDGVIEEYRTARTNGMDKLFEYYNAQKFGHKVNNKAFNFNKFKTTGIKEVEAFQTNTIKKLPATFLVIGKKENIDFKILEKYGKVEELKLEDVFGY